MKPHFTTVCKPIATAAFAGMTLLCATGTAQAVSLYWGKTPVHTSRLQECLAFANDAMRNLNVQNIRLSRDEVAGTSGGTYAAITCVGTSPVTAVVMVAGNMTLGRHRGCATPCVRRLPELFGSISQRSRRLRESRVAGRKRSMVP
jgi:hypothetical protein